MEKTVRCVVIRVTYWNTERVIIMRGEGWSFEVDVTTKILFCLKIVY